MKNIISIFFAFICVVSFTVNTSEAYMGLGSVYDPIHVQIDQSPLEKLRIERQEVQTLRSSLQAKYGESEYYACYDYSPCTKNDLSFPGASKMCEYQIQSCLSRGSYKSKINTSTIKNNVPIKKSGFDQVCESASGPNSFYSGETDINKGGGIGGCSCKSGFKFSEGNYGQCVPLSTKSNDQICSEAFPNSKWDGTYIPNTGKLSCGCVIGFQWNTSATQCVTIANKVIQQNVNSNIAPTCSISFVPQTIEVNKYFTIVEKTTGNITNVIASGTGDSNYYNSSNPPWTGSDPVVVSLKNGGGLNKARASIIGKASRKLTVIGPGGSNTCSGSYTVIPNKSTVKKVLEEKIETPSDISATIQAPSTGLVGVSESATLKNVGLWTKLVNWFK